MGAGVGDKIRITDQKGRALHHASVSPPTGKLAAGTGTVDYISTFCTTLLSRFALELCPGPSGYFYLRKQKSFPENMFPN